MKTLITALVVSVAINSYAQAPDKTSDTQFVGRDEAVNVSIGNYTAGPILQVSISQPDKTLDPNFGPRTLVSSGNGASPQKSGSKPRSAEPANKPVTSEDVKVRLFRSNGEEIAVTALDPKGSFFGTTGVESIQWGVSFKVIGADVAAVDRAEVEYAGTRLIFKIHDYVPPKSSTP